MGVGLGVGGEEASNGRNADSFGDFHPKTPWQGDKDGAMVPLSSLMTWCMFYIWAKLVYVCGAYGCNPQVLSLGLRAVVMLMELKGVPQRNEFHSLISSPNIFDHQLP